jgi:uncharacterized protein YndB with AHSA1/START domain
MTERSVRHATIRLERTYAAPPARVFAAWSTPAALARWAMPGDGWTVAFDRFEFEPGGIEISRFGPPDGATYVNHVRYEDIVPDARIVSSSAMTCGERRLFAGLLTVELHPAGAGCRMVVTEQGAFLDGHDRPEHHEAGWGAMLDNLAAELRRAAA